MPTLRRSEARTLGPAAIIVLAATLLVVGFGYSYFWTASTIIYLLMRRKVDDTEMDEIHLEEEPEQPWTPPAPAAPPAGEPAKGNATPAQMVEPPAMRHPVDLPPAASPTVPVPPPEAPVAPPAAEPVKEPPPGEGLPPLGGTAP